MNASRDLSGLTVGGAAERFGLRPHVLRHLESVGLLAPGRTAAGERRYADRDLYQIAVVLRAKEAGLSLEHIARMMVCDPNERDSVLQRRRDELVREIAAARQSLDLIECALACDHQALPSARTSRSTWRRASRGLAIRTCAEGC